MVRQAVITSPLTERILVNALVGASFIALIIGLLAPMLTLKKLILITNTFSVSSGVLALFREGDYLLSFIIFGFSIVLPLVKIGLLFRVWNAAEHGSQSVRYFCWLTNIGRWSMLDVFVVAVLVASVKLGALASVEVHYGLYAFALSVVLVMLASGRVKHVMQTNEQNRKTGEHHGGHGGIF